MTAEPLRWACIGTGLISRDFVPDLIAADDVVVDLIQSRNPANAARFAEEYGVPRSTGSYEEVLADGSIDAIYLATPFASHFDMARRALEAGKHVLVEKPMVTSAAEAEELFAIGKRNGVFVMEAMWFKFNRALQRARAEVDRGAIGEVRSVRASFGVPFPEEAYPGKWDVARSGGALLDQGIYAVTLAHTILGTPTDVYARGQVRGDGLDLAQHFTLEFDDGRYAQCASSLNEFTELTASIAGTRGWITLAAPFWATQSLTIYPGGPAQGPLALDEPFAGNGFATMISEVTRAIRNGLLQHPAHAAEETVAVFRTLDAIRADIANT